MAAALTAQDFEVDHDGRWILRATIVSGKVEQQVRLILDTGAEVTLLDASMKGKLGLRLIGKASVADLGKTSRQLETVEADSIRIGPHRLQAPHMLLADIQSRFRGTTDNRIDGLLGMDILRHVAFRWDESSKTINWGLGGPSQYDQSIPIEFVKGLPYLPIRLGENATLAMFDTGAVGAGFILPMTAMGDTGHTEGRSAFGSISFVEGTFKGRIELGTAAWINPQVDFVRQNTEKVILGNRLFRNNKFAVDFKLARFYLQCGPGEMMVPEPRRLKLALRWDEHGHLVIAGMKPGGPFERAGFRLGDRLLRLGDLQGTLLTIQTAFQYLDNQAMVKATIIRSDKEIQLFVD